MDGPRDVERAGGACCSNLDLRGLSCPIPVLRVREALESGVNELRVLAEPASVANIIRLAQSKGCQVEFSDSTGTTGRPSPGGEIRIKRLPAENKRRDNL